LLVEDETVVAMMMAEALTELGFSIVGPCGSTAEAIAAIAETKVDAAILDINLGDELVYPLADALKAEGIPLVFVTGYGAESVDSRFAQTPLLQKPIDIKALKDIFVASGEAVKLASSQKTIAKGADPGQSRISRH
jgi:CheY-like chemotaxis protein